jgi:hypothetical protein
VCRRSAGVLCLAISLTSAASGSANANSWLTGPQARELTASRPVLVWTCASGTGSSCTYDDGRRLSLRILHGTIRGNGASRQVNGQTVWQRFLLNVTCGFDVRSRHRFHGRFIWEADGTPHGRTASPNHLAQTGRVYPACTA